MRLFVVILVSLIFAGCDYVGDAGAARRALKAELHASDVDFRDMKERKTGDGGSYVCGRYRANDRQEYDFTPFLYSPQRDEVIIYGRASDRANRLTSSLVVAKLCR